MLPLTARLPLPVLLPVCCYHNAPLTAPETFASWLLRLRYGVEASGMISGMEIIPSSTRARADCTRVDWPVLPGAKRDRFGRLAAPRRVACHLCKTQHKSEQI